ncbi:MAG TPA: MerR family transcriptional regulator [Actinomycetota bacterium]|nr:MerR family transcriptional regulator [Actinomycetota bacterium]
MASYRISELAEQAGVPASTLRYYERIGLLNPDAREPNGYRRYGETAVDRLAFIARAKGMGMPLDEVGQLADLWFTGECGPIQERLHRYLSDRIEAVAGRIADDTAFRDQLERMLARLDPDSASGRCGPDCGCDLEPPGPGAAPLPVAVAAVTAAVEVASGPRGPGPAGNADLAGIASLLPSVSACSLSESDAAERVARWQRVAGQAQRRERVEGGLRLCFPTSPAIGADLGELCAAEAGCCPGLHFTLEVWPAATVLTVTGC